MSLEDRDIRLEINQAPLQQPQNVVDAWGHIMQDSVESINAGIPDVFSFADNHCLYFFIIQRTFIADDEEDMEKKILPSEPVAFGPGRYIETIGLVYLTSSHLSGTLNIGISLLPDARTRGFARRSLWLALNWAFTELQCHRIQAQVVDGAPEQRDTNLGLFTGLGFSHEGTLRRALFYPTQPVGQYPPSSTAEWRDIINLSILDMDWFLRKATPRIPRQLVKSRWDELFARHESERQAMLRLEEWEEERRNAVGQSAASTEVTGTMASHTAGDHSQLEAAWETSSQASEAPALSHGDARSQHSAQHQLSSPHPPAEEILAHTSRKRSKKSRAKSKKPATAVTQETLSSPPSLKHVEPIKTIAVAGVDGSLTSSQQPASDNWRTSNPAFTVNIPSPTGPKSNFFKRARSSLTEPGRKLDIDEIWETASNSTSLSEATNISDLGPETDVESVPRSPSVTSTSSRLSVSTTESWDMLETMSTESYDIPGFPDTEN